MSGLGIELIITSQNVTSEYQEVDMYNYTTLAQMAQKYYKNNTITVMWAQPIVEGFSGRTGMFPWEIDINDVTQISSNYIIMSSSTFGMSVENTTITHEMGHMFGMSYGED